MVHQHIYTLVVSPNLSVHKETSKDSDDGWPNIECLFGTAWGISIGISARLTMIIKMKTENDSFGQIEMFR